MLGSAVRMCKWRHELGVGKEKAWCGHLVWSFFILTTQELGDKLWRAPEQRSGPWVYWKSMTQRALTLQAWGHYRFPAQQTRQEWNHWRGIWQLKKILGTLKEIQVVYPPKKYFLELKTIVFNQKKKSVYVLKEGSLVTAETQIVAWKNMWKKYFKAQSK